jgi:minor extracellular serine protease Vpr
MHRFAPLAILFAAAILLASCAQWEAPNDSLASQQAEPLRTDYTEQTLEATQTEYAIVTFKSPPVASYTGDIPGLARTKPQRSERLDENTPAVRAYLRHLENEHANFRSFLNRSAPRAEIVQEYFLTLNAVAVDLNGASLRTLQRGPDVKAAAYSGLYRPTLNRSVGIISADAFWSTTGSKGDGIDVAVIDSGIDFTHDFFACKTPSEAKVYASGVAFFDPDRILVNDHGTHVAGIVAGCENTTGPTVKGGALTLSGVAPEASVHDYNVFPGFGAGYVAFGGSAFSHDIAAAIEDAVRDDMHVINMSLGGSVDGPHDFLAEASNAAVDAGLVVVTSAGNSGPDQYTVGSPGTAEKSHHRRSHHQQSHPRCSRGGRLQCRYQH